MSRGNPVGHMNRCTYTVERNGRSVTVERFGWAEAAVSVCPDARPISWEVIRAPVPYTLLEVTGEHEEGYVLVNGEIKVYRHRL